MAMSGLGASWREGLPDPVIQEILKFARERGLDLSVRREEMDPWEIQVEERVDPEYVKKLVRDLQEEGGWPEGMPLPVVSGGATVTLLDGSHRTTAARVAGFSTIPVLVVSPDSFRALSGRFDIPNFDLVHSILPAVDPLMEENERKDQEGGRAKKRTVDSWDMDAFQSPEMEGVRRGLRVSRDSLPEYLYHSTFADRIWNIAKLGLLPSETPRWSGQLGEWSIGKIFFSSHPSAAAFYAATHFARQLVEDGESPDPVLLRVASKNLKDVNRDTFSADDWFIEHSIPPGEIEVWVPWRKGWAPIKEVSREVSKMETVRGEPGSLDVDPEAGAHIYTDAYFRKFWPKDEASS
jgi:hypothetical protein